MQRTALSPKSILLTCICLLAIAGTAFWLLLEGKSDQRPTVDAPHSEARLNHTGDAGLPLQ
jgi:hypothetical protein